MNIEELSKIFKEHSQKIKDFTDIEINQFRESFPEEAIPKEMTDSFNLPEALACMCEEILKLKRLGL